MGFINNHKDNFLPSSHPWGDDNVTVYNRPKKRVRQVQRKMVNPSDLGYVQLCDTISQMKSALDTLPNSENKLRLRSRLMDLIEEKRKRDMIEAQAAVERDDAFDKKEKVIKEDVKPSKPQQTERLPLSADEVMDMFDLDDDEDEDYEIPQPQPDNNQNLNNFLIASLVVICLISVMKK